MREILPTDWTFFVFTILATILAAPLNIYFVTDVLRYELKNKKRAYVISLIVGAVMGIISSFFLADSRIYEDSVTISDVGTGAATIFLMFYIALNMREKKWKRVAVTFFSMDILDNLNSIFSGLRNHIWIIYETEDSFMLSFTRTVISFPALILEFLLFFIIARLRREKDREPFPLSMLLVLEIILNIFDSILYTYNLIYADRDSQMRNVLTPIYISFMLCALVFVFIAFYMRASSKERADLKEMNRLSEELILSESRYFETSVKADTQIRSLRHDMKNNTQVLMLLLENKEYDRMKEYLEEMDNDIRSTDISAHTGNTIADAIISEKKEKARNAGSELKVSGEISFARFSPVDMCRILANLIDNAIEAVSSDELKGLDPEFKVIDLVFRKTEKFFMISIKNPCAKKPEMIGERYVSGKKDPENHGLGLESIRNAALRYEGEMSIDLKEMPYGYDFTAELLFPYDPV